MHFAAHSAEKDKKVKMASLHIFQAHWLHCLQYSQHSMQHMYLSTKNIYLCTKYCYGCSVLEETVPLLLLLLMNQPLKPEDLLLFRDLAVLLKIFEF